MMKLSIMHLRLLAHCTSITHLNSETNLQKSLVQVTFTEINCRIYNVFTLTIYHSHSRSVHSRVRHGATHNPFHFQECYVLEANLASRPKFSAS